MRNSIVRPAALVDSAVMGVPGRGDSVTRAAIETRILSLYTAGHEAESYNIRSIARAAGAAYPHVHTAVKAMAKDGILRTSTVGNAVFCSLDLTSDLGRNLLDQARLRKQSRALERPNLRNLRAEVRRLAVEEPRLVAAILHGDRLRLIVTDKAAARPILARTSLFNVSFSTPDELRAELLKSMALLEQGVVLLGYERILLQLLPIQEQLFLNHSELLRGRKEARP